MKYDFVGKKLWQRLPKLENPIEWDGAWALALDPFGNLHAGGSLGIHKYDSQGNLVWLAQANGVRAIAVAADGSVCAVGRSEPGVTDKYEVIKIDAHGRRLWTSRFSGAAEDYLVPVSVRFDDAGNVCAAGSEGTARFDTNGNLLWLASESRVRALEVDASGHIYVAGSAYGHEPGYGLRTIKYDPGGRIQWVAHYSAGDALFHRVAGLKLDHGGNLWITGTAENDIVTLKYAQAEHFVGKFSSVAASVGGGVEILFQGSPGSEYRLEASTNFVNWLSLTNVLSGPALLKWTDHSRREVPSRFYRAVIQPNIRP